jgi:TP901 family phage tail tape measure protein
MGTAVTVISEFDRGMSELAAVTRATSSDLADLRDVAKDMGASTEFTARQAADGLTFLARAGFSAQESMAAIPAVLDLATASGMDLGRAADISSNIMSAFGIAATDAASAADVLAAAASRSNKDVQQLGDAMTYVGPIASALDISMSDAAAAIGVLSDAGIQGSMAGTSLRQILSSLVKPVGAAATAIKDMGLTLDQVNPETNSLTDIMQTLSDAGLDAADAMAIFGDRGGPAILALTSQSANLARLTDELRDVDGAAFDMATTMRDDLRGDLDSAFSAAQGLIIALGDAGLTAILRGMVQTITMVTRGFTAMVDAIASVPGYIAEFLGMGAAQRELAEAADAVATAMNEEIAKSDILSGSLTAGRTMSIETANVKLAQAQAHLAVVDAMRQEAIQDVKASEAFQRQVELQRQGNELVRQYYEFREQAAQAGEEEGRADAERLRTYIEGIQTAVAVQQELLAEVSETSAEYTEAQAQIALLQAALENATGETVTLGGAAGDAADDTEQLALHAQNIKFESAAAAAREMAEQLGISLATAMSIQNMSKESRTGVSGPDGAIASLQNEGRIGGGLTDVVSTWSSPDRNQTGGGGGGRSGGKSEAERQAEAIRTVTEALQDEINTIAMAEEARRTYDELKRAGVELYSTEGQAIADMVEELSRMESQQARTATAMEAIESSAQSAFASFVTGASSAREAVAGLLSSLADMAANAAFESLVSGMFGGGGGGGGSAFSAFAGAVFGGGSAASVPSMDGGGYTGNAPRSGGLDGKGGFLAMMHPQETVIDHTKAQGGGGVTVAVNIDARGAVDGVAEQVNRQIRQQLPEISKTVVAAVADAQGRGRS